MGVGGVNTSMMVADTVRNVTATRPKAKAPRDGGGVVLRQKARLPGSKLESPTDQQIAETDG